MKQHQARHQGIGRRTRLATCLGIALALGTGSALAAQTGPQANPARHGNPDISQILKTSQSSGSADTTWYAGNFEAPHSTTAPASTWTVSSCADSGPGTLRNIVDSFAGDGDTIDLTGCSLITLQSSIVTYIDNLTLKGDLSDSLQKYGSISGDQSVRPLVHYGSGTLTLDNIQLQQGYYAGYSGGCVFSSGNVTLRESEVKYCTVKNTAGPAFGAGIDALGDVTINASKIHGNEAIGSTGAYGGGVYARGDANLGLAKYNQIRKNSVTVTGSGPARGGGIFTLGDLTDWSGSALKSNTASGDNSSHGGGAYVGGNTHMIQSILSSNTADGDGGGLYSVGDVTLDGVDASKNSAKLGGGIFTEAAADISNSTIADNDAANGGGLRLNGDVSIDRSTISGNTSGNVAGASIGDNATQDLSITQSTISGNISSSSVFGAGLFLKHDTVIKNSTITENVEANSGDNRHGAGIALDSNVNVTLSSSIVSGNKIDRSSGGMMDSDIGMASGRTPGSLNGDYNVIGQLVHAGLTLPSNTLNVTDPGLQPLADNGGPTLTHMPMEGSDARGWGLANGFSTDQRGSGYSRVIVGFPDAGSVESFWDDVIFRDGFD